MTRLLGDPAMDREYDKWRLQTPEDLERVACELCGKQIHPSVAEQYEGCCSVECATDDN